jgi:hypothetical protein
MSHKKKPALDPKKAYRLMKRLHKQLVYQAVALVSEASSLLDYEDEKNPTYGIKFRCEKFIKEIRKEWQ